MIQKILCIVQYKRTKGPSANVFVSGGKGFFIFCIVIFYFFFWLLPGAEDGPLDTL